MELWQFAIIVVAVCVVLAAIVVRKKEPTMRDKLRINLAEAKQNHLTHAMDASHHLALASMYRDRVTWLEAKLEEENEYGSANLHPHRAESNRAVVATGFDVQAPSSAPAVL